jgi:signal transduction histidine kinase
LFRTESGGILEIQGVAKNISERVKHDQLMYKANMELVQMNIKLKETQKILVNHEKLASIGILAAGIAHEINNPLGFVKSNFNRLEKNMTTFMSAWNEIDSLIPSVSEIAQKYRLSRIMNEFPSLSSETREGLSRIVSIVSNLKTFARTANDEKFEEIDINAVIDSTLIVAWNSIKYVADVQRQFGNIPYVWAHEGEIKQVFLNIVINAAQAIESMCMPSKGLIRITTSSQPNRVLIIISNNGPPIPEESKAQIFDPFFTTKEPGKGTGLGLSISYDIVVNKHKGILRVESAPGIDTSFIIELPVRPMRIASF